MNTLSNPFSELATFLAPGVEALVRFLRRLRPLRTVERVLEALGNGELACEAFARRPVM
jgi:hypothetical protein